MALSPAKKLMFRFLKGAITNLKEIEAKGEGELMTFVFFDWEGQPTKKRPVFPMIIPEGVPTQEGKDIFARGVRDAAVISQPDFIIVVADSWVVEASPQKGESEDDAMKRATKYLPSEHPEAYEALMVSVNSEKENCMVSLPYLRDPLRFLKAKVYSVGNDVEDKHGVNPRFAKFDIWHGQRWVTEERPGGKDSDEEAVDPNSIGTA